jgi:ABC-2 type transport system permease protein
MLRHLITKEFIQVRRDRRMLPIIFVAPVVQLIILGYAASLDVKDIPAVVCDHDRSQESLRYVSTFFSSGYFVRTGGPDGCNDLDGALDRGDADVAIVVPSGFGNAVSCGESATVQAIVNGSDANAGGVGLNYVMQISNRYSAAIMIERFRQIGTARISLVDVRDRVLYNPELRSRFFMVPAILALLLMITTAMLTAIAVVKEKEIGTMEQLIVTPVRSWQIILGKLLPFTFIGLIDVLIVAAVAVLWFKVPLNGSFWLLLLLSMVFLLTTLGLGLLVSTLSRTQQQAMLTLMFFVLLPFMYLSGFIFPIENMPRVFQIVTYAVPLRYYLTIVRGIFLKGVGIETLWPDTLALAGIGLAILFVAILRFRKHI